LKKAALNNTRRTTEEVGRKFFEIFNKDDNSVESKQEMRNIEEEDNSENENETEVNLDPPTKIEIQLALSQLKNGKAAGLDDIYLEVLKIDPEITA
jgi:hypothetical protein